MDRPCRAISNSNKIDTASEDTKRTAMSSEPAGSLPSHERGVLPPSSGSDPPVSSRFDCGASAIGGEIFATNISQCGVGHDGDITIGAGVGAGRTSGSSSQPASPEDEIRRAKFASALHLSMSNGGKNPRSPRHSSLSIDISRLPPMQVKSEDADDDSSSKESDNEGEGPSTSPHDGQFSSNKASRRGRRVHRVLAEAASSPSLGSIDDNKRGASPRSFNLQPRPNRHSPSPNESPSVDPSSSVAPNASTDKNMAPTCTRPPPSFGRISPHLHLDLSCVAVPPLNSTSSSHETRCRSDSEATLGTNEVCAASVAAGVRQPAQQSGIARPSIEPPPWAVAAKGEARLEVRYHCISSTVMTSHSHFIVTISSLMFLPSSACNSRFANHLAFKVPSTLQPRPAFESAGHHHPTSSCCTPLLAGVMLYYFTTPMAVATSSTAEVPMVPSSMAKG